MSTTRAVTVVSKANCSYCDMAKEALTNAGVSFSVQSWEDMTPEQQSGLRIAVGGSRVTFPQIFIGDHRVPNGCRGLIELIDADELVPMMTTKSTI